jgi:LysM repeat protein
MPQLYSLEARAYEGLKRNDEAMAKWEAIHSDYPQSTYAAEATVRLAQAKLESALQSGSSSEIDEAYEMLRQIEQNHAESDAYPYALLGFARIDLYDAQRDPQSLLRAQKTLNRLIGEHPEFAERKTVEQMLGELNMRLLRSDLTQEGEEIYEVKPGDVLERIGRNFGVNYEMIMLVNGITDVKRLRPGQKLKIPNFEFSIVVNIGDNTLTLLNHGQFFKKYSVRTGARPGQTPVGDFKVDAKEKDPTWWRPEDGKQIPRGDPENELGTRWIGFRSPDFGIHGTIHPESIGQYASNGCVGMLMADVEELYDMISIGAPVKIIGERQATRLRGEE